MTASPGGQRSRKLSHQPDCRCLPGSKPRHLDRPKPGQACGPRRSRIPAPMRPKALAQPPDFTAHHPEKSPPHPVSTHLRWRKWLMPQRNRWAKGIKGLEESEISKAADQQNLSIEAVRCKKGVLCFAVQRRLDRIRSNAAQRVKTALDVQPGVACWNRSPSDPRNPSRWPA